MPPDTPRRWQQRCRARTDRQSALRRADVASKALQSEDLTGPFTGLTADWRAMSFRQVLHSRNGSDCSGDTVTPDVSERPVRKR